MPQHYTAEGLERALAELSPFFDRVRVVEPVRAIEQHLTQPIGDGTAPADYNCYSVWTNQRERCANCVGLRAMQEGIRQTKYEFDDSEMFYIVAAPVVVDGRPMAMELISKVNDHVLLKAYGVNEFVSRVTAFNAQLHMDDGTGLYNKHYFDEKLFLMANKASLNKTDVAVAMMDVDGFEHVANHFGHNIADEAIIAIGRLLTANVSRRRGDFVARYGTNTFAIVLDNIPRLMLRERMVDMVQRVTTLRLQGYEDVRLNVAMGVYLFSENRNVSVSDIAQIVTHRVEVARAAGVNRIAFSDR